MSPTLDPAHALAKRLEMQGALNKTNSTYFRKGTTGTTFLQTVLGDNRRSTNLNKAPPSLPRQFSRNAYGPSRQGGKSILDPTAWAVWFAGKGTSQQRYK